MGFPCVLTTQESEEGEGGGAFFEEGACLILLYCMY